MSETTRRLHHELDLEVERLATSSAVEGADDAGLEAYDVRVRGLRDAVVSVEREGGR